ncbi:hypothetical protein SAMN05444394_0746 [Algoriphagus halophilus]|uniref:Uncharacterized protein n=1 Tax=Algoriphagus halophilus TaxID=226505 RepID=A0A1N6DDH3_9BACT|nr:hypothetical protein SAMN05444394_0746 [Algoriphagus halophilus]
MIDNAYCYTNFNLKIQLIDYSKAFMGIQINSTELSEKGS